MSKFETVKNGTFSIFLSLVENFVFTKHVRKIQIEEKNSNYLSVFPKHFKLSVSSKTFIHPDQKVSNFSNHFTSRNLTFFKTFSLHNQFVLLELLSLSPLLTNNHPPTH